MEPAGPIDYAARPVPFGEIFALTAAASWAVGSLLFARIGRRASPGAMNLGKCAAASVVLCVARAALAPRLGPIAWPAEATLLLGASGLVGLAIGDTAYFGAILALGVPRAILLLSAAPVFATLGGVALLGERIGGREAAGIGLTLAGIALVVTGRVPAPPPPAVPAAGEGGAAGEGSVPVANPVVAVKNTSGVVLGVVAALGQAGGSLLSRRAMGLGIDPLGAAAGRLVTGAVGLAVIAAISGHLRPWVGDLRKEYTWIKVSGASLIGTVAGLWLAQIAIATCSSTGVATTLLATSPIFALPLAHAVGHERITPRGVAGTLVALSGVVLLSLRA